MRRTLSLLGTALLLTACMNIGPGATVPPINVPSIPPVNVPSINVPSIPPINVPSIPPINVPSIPPIDIPSIPPIDIPSGLGSGTCGLLSAAEVGTIFGSTPQITDDSSGDCTFTFSNFSTIIVSIESDTDLATSKFLFGETSRDITVAGMPAVTGVFIGQPAVHVQRGTSQLQILGVLTGSDDATVAKLVQVAELAASRWP